MSESTHTTMADYFAGIPRYVGMTPAPIVREFAWEDGFTPYAATLRGETLTEYARGAVERRSRVVARPEWDGHPNSSAYAMGDGFAAGDVDGVDAVWIDGRGYELHPMPSGDFDCCAYGHGECGR